MTFITWACLRCVQELATILGPQNPTQKSCEHIYMKIATNISFDCNLLSIIMIALPNSAANLAQKEDAVTKYACLAQSKAQLGLALSAKENIST